MRNHLLTRVVSPVLLVLASSPVLAQGLMFSTSSPAAIDGPNGPGSTQFNDGSVVHINPNSGIGTIYLLDQTINDGGLPDLNALYVFDDGSIVFSTQSGAAGYAFDDDELVQYDPVTDTLSLFYDFGGFMTTNADEDIDGFHLLPNGNFLISNVSDFSLDGQDFRNGDIVLWDPIAETAAPFFDESLFGGTDVWVRSVSMLDNGNLLLSAFNEDTGGSISLGGLTFGRGDVVEYDLTSGTASLYMSVAVFGGATEDIDALSTTVIPLPAAVWLLLPALALIGRRR